MFLLLLSFLVLAAGPFILRATRSVPAALPAVDGFAFVAVGGLVVFSVIPESLRSGGPVAAAAVVIGLLGPGLAERLLHRAAHRVHAMVLWIAMAGLAAHAFVDGVALRPVGHGGQTLALAVILHRLPVALTIWLLVQPTHGRRAAAGVLAVIAAGTAAGFCLGPAVIGRMSGPWFGVFQAFVAGSLFHVVLHGIELRGPGKRDQGWQLSAAAGALLAIALLTTIELAGGHGHGTGTAGGHAHEGPGVAGAAMALEIALAAAPALLGALPLLVLFGALADALPRRAAAPAASSPLASAARGALLALVRTPDSAGSVASRKGDERDRETRRAVSRRRGRRTGPALLAWLSAPAAHPAAIALAAAFLGTSFAVLLGLVALLGAIALGWLTAIVGGCRGSVTGPVTGSSVAKNQADDAPVRGAKAALAGLHPWRRALAVAFDEVFTTAGAWLIVGVAVAAAASGLMCERLESPLSGSAGVPLLALAGLALHLHPAASLPLAALLTQRGLPAGPALALILSSSISRRRIREALFHGPEGVPPPGKARRSAAAGLWAGRPGQGSPRLAALVHTIGVLALASAAGWAANGLLAPGQVVPLGHRHVFPSDLAQASLLAALAAGLLAVCRHGPRGLLERVLPQRAGPAHRLPAGAPRHEERAGRC